MWWMFGLVFGLMYACDYTPQQLYVMKQCNIYVDDLDYLLDVAKQEISARTTRPKPHPTTLDECFNVFVRLELEEYGDGYGLWLRATNLTKASFNTLSAICIHDMVETLGRIKSCKSSDAMFEYLYTMPINSVEVQAHLLLYMLDALEHVQRTNHHGWIPRLPSRTRIMEWVKCAASKIGFEIFI